METEQNLITTDLIIDSESHANLKESAMWAKLLGIVGFVYSAIIVIAAIFMAYTFSRLSYGLSSSTSMLSGGGIMLMYLIMAVISFFMSLYLFRFAGKIQAALKTTDQEALNEGIKNLKSFFRIAGVLTVIMLVFSVLALVGVVMAASFGR